MLIKDKVKRCTGSFNCRFRTALLSTAVLVALAVAVIILLGP